MRHRSNIAALQFLFVVFLTACLLPQPFSQTPPTADANSIATIIAGTAAAAAAQTQAASQSPLAAETATSIPLPTPSATAAPVFSIHDTALMYQTDSTTLFIDRKGGYQLVLPADWMAVRIDEQEYLTAFALPAASDPVILDRLTRLQDSDPNQFRLEVIDIRPGHVVNGVITNMSVVVSLNEQATLAEYEEILDDNPPPFDNYELVSSELTQTDGFESLVREQTWDSIVPGETTYQKNVFIRWSDHVLSVQVSSNLSFKDTVLPEYEQVLSSLQPYTP